ncbi:hypothetical protein L211DRAFT_897370 [Terfezia boudieri ATCC MYA-4762]|uniref:Uncharacterized protein n=1 Tax=Terfezia boudieri ATCC MYA-4762 TaxID=1051890 RepID=A0A3N4LG32_9PEZI|nr:hypothetical protein L211DRAFT_897370 [Terfezia boudieri ATCC MYA-4762]
MRDFDTWLRWWDDYDSSDKPAPNCWKKASDALHVPDGLVEVSLFDLLVQQFDPTVDAQQAELELDSYRWNPLDKKGLGVVPFRGHAAWGSKCKAIRNTFPDWLKKQIRMTATEDDFWKGVTASVNTELVDRLERSCPICLKPGHTADDLKSAYNYPLIDVLTKELLIQLPTRFTTFKDPKEPEYVAKEGFLRENKEPSEDEVDNMMDIMGKADEEMDELPS